MDDRMTLAELRQQTLVEERLKAIAAQLIAAHRSQDHSLVVPYARQAGLTTEGQGPQHLFMKTIQVFHPDRLAGIWARIQQAVRTSDQRRLDELTSLLTFHSGRSPRGTRPIDWEPEEPVYGFDVDEEVAEASDEAWDEDYGTFLWAVKRELFGNLDLVPHPQDLRRLDGELDLSNYGLHDLGGIEFCLGLSGLNLSRNNIDNVYPLKDLVKLEVLDLAENDLEDADSLGGLWNLKELDLSANEIDDVAFLDRLVRLRYVDLTGNPVRNKAVLARLEARGVIVIL